MLIKNRFLTSLIIFENYFFIIISCFVDLNSVPKNLIVSNDIIKRYSAKTNCKFTWINFTNNQTRAQLQVSLPPKLRLIERSGGETRLTIQVVNGNATIRIRELSGIHNGLYSALRTVFLEDNQTSIEQRKDFIIIVTEKNFSSETDLGREGDLCNEDSACQSNNCFKNRCVCDGEKPVQFRENCYSAQPIGSSCDYSKQCIFTAGTNSECGHSGLCRCQSNSFLINIPFHGKYCIEPKGFNDNCTYSEECQAIGANRYCNQDYRCECIPGFTYKTGIGCRNTANSRSSIYLTSSLTISLAILTFRIENYFIV